MNVFLTGVSGFVGSRIASLSQFKSNINLTASARRPIQVSAVKKILVMGLDASTDWSSALSGQQVVIHTAGLAHITKKKADEISSHYYEINVKGALNLARQAASSGVKRFIFISSIGVNGNTNARPFTEDDMPNPQGPYASSKWQAEQGLWEIQEETGMEVVVIRPPLVYGKGAPGNFGMLKKWVNAVAPLPLGSVASNKRSFIALDNLVDFILHCADYKKTPQAANQTFVISDGEDVSTAELFQKVAKAYGKKSRLFAFPVWLLRLGAKLAGKQAMADRLLGSLQVDSSKARELLGWKPIITMDDQLQKMAEADLGKK